MTYKAKTVLIAEDDSLVRRTMSHYLTGLGYIVLEAGDGNKALQLCREKQPHILLTDLRMPELDGLELIRTLVKEYPELPVIIISGLGTMSDVIEALRCGAWDYLTKPITDLDILTHSISKALERVRHLRREKRYQANLEEEIKKRTQELQERNKQLEQEMRERKVQEGLLSHARQEWEHTIDVMPDMIAIVDREHAIVRMNKTMLNQLKQPHKKLVGKKCYHCVHNQESPPDYCPHTKLLQDGKTHRAEIYEEHLGGHCEIIVTPYYDPDGTLLGSIHITRNINEQKKETWEKEKLQSQLLHAQKLESVGRLAAGIAHEINTPTQFIGTNIAFLDEAEQDIADFITQIQEIAEKAPQEVNAAIAKALEEMDWDYLSQEIPLAINQSYEGVKRVRSIVRAMKEFSHPGNKEKTALNLNQLINTTVTVARNEWKYVANIELNLDPELPKIPLLADEMGQVVLNMIVNAAHAIAERPESTSEKEKGLISITTQKGKKGVELHIRDSGQGIPEEAKPRIFDPFYTTKTVGKGTGQGLTISHDVITEKHDGTITFESEQGKGTHFIITLPLDSSTEEHEQ